MINDRVYDAETLKKLQRVELDMFAYFDQFCKKHGIRYFAIAGSAIGAMRHQGMIPWDDDIDIGMVRADYEKFLRAAKRDLDPKYEVWGPDSKHKYYNLVPNLNLKGTKFVVDLAEGKYAPGIFMDLFVFENIPEDPKGVEKQIRKTQLWRNLYILSNIDYLRFLKGERLTMKIRYIVCGAANRILNVRKRAPERIYRRYLKEALKNNGKTKNYTILGDPFARKCIIAEDEIFPTREVAFEGITIQVPNKCEDMLTRRFGNYMQMPPVEKRVNHCPMELDFGEY